MAGLADASNVHQSKMASGETVEEVLKGIIGKIGENIVLSRAAKVVAGDAGRPAGLLFHYIHPPGKIGVLVEIVTSKAELAKDAAFEEFARDIAMHVAASSPLCTRREEVPSDVLAQEREIYRNQALNEGKPEKIVDKIVEGRVQKFYAESCLLEQPFAKNPDQKVEEYVKQNAAKFGPDVTVSCFLRYKLGETVSGE